MAYKRSLHLREWSGARRRVLEAVADTHALLGDPPGLAPDQVAVEPVLGRVPLAGEGGEEAGLAQEAAVVADEVEGETAVAAGVAAPAPAKDRRESTPVAWTPTRVARRKLREAEFDSDPVMAMDNDTDYIDRCLVLTAEEAATLLRVSTKTLLREARDGVPGQKIGRSWRFSRSELLARLAAPQGTDT
jgi:excisionase family DNA binding protein